MKQSDVTVGTLFPADKQPVRSTNKIAFIASRSGTRGLWQPKACAGRGGKSGSISDHSSFGILQPSSLVTSPMPTRVHFSQQHGQLFFAIRKDWTHTSADLKLRESGIRLVIQSRR
jgi:hypothetical protein